MITENMWKLAPTNTKAVIAEERKADGMLSKHSEHSRDNVRE